MNVARALYVTPLLAVALLLSACDEPRSRNAPVRTEEREIEPFNSIDLRGDARLEITVGSNETLALEGRAGYIERISTQVRGDTLYIRSKRRDWLWTEGDPRVTIRISVPSLESLRLRGGNDVRLDGFDGGASKIKIEGAAHIVATGQLDELTVRMSGAGHADLSKLIANEAKVTVDGVGSVYVNTKESLDATMNGVGAILYSGNPREVNTAMNGLGTIARRDRADQESGHEPGPEIDPKIDPDELQPEYEREPQLERIESTEVI
jgi:hypothetical protein